MEVASATGLHVTSVSRIELIHHSRPDPVGAATVMPFILRAVRMVGVEVTTCPLPLRKTAWTRLSKELPADLLVQIYKVISLEEVPQCAKQLLAGQISGWVIVNKGLINCMETMPIVRVWMTGRTALESISSGKKNTTEPLMLPWR